MDSVYTLSFIIADAIEFAYSVDAYNLCLLKFGLMHFLS